MSRVIPVNPNLAGKTIHGVRVVADIAGIEERIDIVALSFSGCMNPNQIVEGLTELRAKLPAGIDLWAGGAAPALHRRPVDGVRAIAAISQIHDELQAWRARPAKP